mgnify:CR=1 FL=1
MPGESGMPPTRNRVQIKLDSPQCRRSLVDRLPRHRRPARRVLMSLVLAARVLAFCRDAGAVQPTCPAAPATLAIFVDNRSADPSVALIVSGELRDAAATCSGSAAVTYARTLTCSGAGLARCGEIADLLPGTWVHRLALTAGGSDPQEQAQRTVLVAEAWNALVWTAYPRTFVVSEANEASLRAQLDAATSYTDANPGPALVTFARAVFPGVQAPQTIDLARGTCTPDPLRHAALCFTGSRVVVDALDAQAEYGGVVWSVGTSPLALLRLYGSDNVFRGLVLAGSREPAPLTQMDTVAIVGPAAVRNRLEQSRIGGPTMGDAVSVEGGAGASAEDANVIEGCELSGAKDKGLKVTTGAHAVLSRTCVHDNLGGGVQATLGGHATAIENVVQHNVPGAAGNGLGAIGNEAGEASTLATDGNVVRFAGGRGLSVVDNAQGSFRNDYVADNQFAGVTVETSAVGLSAVPPLASFRGVALVCNRNAGVSGSCPPVSGGEGTPCGTDLDCCGSPDGCCVAEPDCAAPLRCGLLSFPRGFGAADVQAAGRPAPDVSYGDAVEPGRNAFAWNRSAPLGANLYVGVPLAAVPAAGNQWEHCGTGAACDTAAVLAEDVRLADGAVVDLGMTSGARAEAPVLTRVSPGRPRRGDLVRAFGEGLNAIEGTACSPDTAPADPCSVENLAVQHQNQMTNANRVRIVASDGTILETIYPDAVTPTMLAFRMPFDCFAPLWLQVAKRNTAGDRVSATIAICDAAGCVGQPAGSPCDDGDVCTMDDRCTGGEAGACAGVPISCEGTCLTGMCDPQRGCVPQPVTAPCSDGKACTLGDHCSGSGDVCIAGGNRVCIGACLTGACDPQSGSCVLLRSGAVCRAEAGVCDVPEYCDGVHGTCGPDVVKNAGTLCRPAAGVCDVAETCTGTDPRCPADAKSTAECRPASNTCDGPERCDGVADTCPADEVRPDTAVCDDGNACTAGETCTAGACGGGTAVVCPACETCDPAAGCMAAPAPACRQPMVPARAQILLRDVTPNHGDRLIWQWLRGGQTPRDAFGDPRASDGYAFCIYDESSSAPRVLLGARAPAASTCSGQPCWAASRSGFTYRSPEYTPDGLEQIALQSGSDGKARVTVRARGEHLAMPALPLATPLRVQLQAANGECWEARYLAAGVRGNTPKAFRAVGVQ